MSQIYNGNIKRPKLQDFCQGSSKFTHFTGKFSRGLLGLERSTAGVM